MTGEWSQWESYLSEIIDRAARRGARFEADIEHEIDRAIDGDPAMTAAEVDLVAERVGLCTFETFCEIGPAKREP